MTMTNGQRIAYLGGSFSVGIFGAFNNYIMSLWLFANFTTSYVLIGLLGNSKSVEGAIVSPLFGVWSDRTWAGWLGRRRVFILVGGLLSALLLAATPAIARMPTPDGLGGLADELARLLPLVGAVVLFTLTFNVGDDLHKALRADLTENAELNFLSSLAIIVDIGAQVGILVLGFLIWTDAVPDWAFFFAGALVAMGVLLTVAGIREPPPAAWANRNPAANAEKPATISPRVFLREYRGAVMFCLVSFAYGSGVNAVLPLITLYVQDELNASVGVAQLLPALLLLSTTLLAIPAGWLATRFGKRRVIGVGYGVMALCAIAGLRITTIEQGAVLFLVAGMGNAAAVVLTIPIMADLVPRQLMGAATGLLAAAGSIAAPLASLIAGNLSQIYGTRAIFAVMAVMTSVAIVLLLGASNRHAAAADAQFSPPGPP